MCYYRKRKFYSYLLNFDTCQMSKHFTIHVDTHFAKVRRKIWDTVFSVHKGGGRRIDIRYWRFARSLDRNYLGGASGFPCWRAPEGILDLVRKQHVLERAHVRQRGKRVRAVSRLSLAPIVSCSDVLLVLTLFFFSNFRSGFCSGDTTIVVGVNFN